jgi:hypothetical protein
MDVPVEWQMDCDLLRYVSGFLLRGPGRAMCLPVSFKFLKKRAVGLISIVILTVLFLQAATTFRLFCPPERLFPSLSSYQIFCSPSLWPIIEYAVYHIPHYEGEKLDQPLLFGILEDFTEVQIFPEDLGLRSTRWAYRQGLMSALDQMSDEDITKFVESYERRRSKKLIALRLENHPVVLSKKGVELGQTEVLKKIHLNSLLEQR